MMTTDQFHDTLREYLHRQPFEPFVVELKDGRRVHVKQLPVVFDDGAASFIDPEDGALVDFFSEEVAQFRPATQEVGS